MIAKHLPDFGLLLLAAELADVKLKAFKPLNAKRDRWQFTLGLAPSKAYQRVSHSGRKVGAVCWHGHRDFFRALFRICQTSDACRDKTAVSSNWSGGKVTYTAENFERTYPATGYQNIGSAFQPMTYRDACVCEDK